MDYDNKLKAKKPLNSNAKAPSQREWYGHFDSGFDQREGEGINAAMERQLKEMGVQPPQAQKPKGEIDYRLPQTEQEMMDVDEPSTFKSLNNWLIQDNSKEFLTPEERKAMDIITTFIARRRLKGKK